MPDFPGGAWLSWPGNGKSRVLVLPDGSSVSGAGLLDRAERTARRLAGIGIRRGHVVATLLPGSLEMAACLVGVPMAATLAPLDPALTDAEVQTCLQELGASALITPQGVRKLQPQPEDPSLEDIALILFTSATTGKPKQVPLSFANLDAMMDKTGTGLALGPADRLLSFMPLFHLQGILSVLTQLRAGGEAVLLPRFEAAAFPAWLDQFEPTWFTAGPAIHNAIQQTGLPRPASTLRLARSSGAKLAPDLSRRLEDLLQAPVLESYGLTEAGSVTQNPLPPGIRKPGSGGVPFGVDVRLLPGGEIAIRGPSVMRGYRRNDAANREAFLDGWLRTGDVGWFDAGGYLYITGRLKEMINRGGGKVAPLEVDEALAAHPGVREAAAFGLPHPTLGEDVAAAVVLQPHANFSAHDLRAHAARFLAPQKIPRRIFFVESLPKGATGKPRRHELTALFSAVKRPDIAPSDALEAELASRWRRHLNIDESCVQTDWYSLGGDSIGLLRMMTEVEAAYGLPPGTLEESGFLAEPNIAALAACLRAPRIAAPVLSFHLEGNRIPFFCLPGANGTPEYLRPLAESLAPDRPVYLLRLPAPESSRARPVEETAAALAARILSIRPAGPYLLGGHCFGGILAWEIAAQLEAACGARGRMALFDAPMPGLPRPFRHWRRYAAKSAALASGLFGGGASQVFQEGLNHLRYLHVMLERRKRAREILKSPESAHNASALAAAPAWNWHPRPLSWDVAVFLAKDGPVRAELLEDPRLAWQGFTHGSFSRFSAEGKHETMFAAPSCESLSGSLSSWLDAGEPAAPGAA